MNRCMITCVDMDLADNLWRMKAFMVGNDFKCWSVGDISRDVNRTFPTHILFKTAGGLGQMMLENILRSLSEYFSNIGYCQVLSMSCCLFNSGNEFCGRCDHHRDRRPEWDWFWRERSERRASASKYGAVGRKFVRWWKRIPNHHRKASVCDRCEPDSSAAHGRIVESRDSWTQTFRFHPPEIHEVLFLCALH